MKYRIGSFNMKNFGAYPKRDFEKIAQIIRDEKMDVVAFQEILSEGKGVRSLLEQAVKFELYNWGFCWASPRESLDASKMVEMIINDSRGEGYAYIWNKQKFNLAEFTAMGKAKIFEPRIINSVSNDVPINCTFFARTPYYIRLQPRYGGFFELRLINIHIYYGNNSPSEVEKRRIEYETLVQDIYPNISQKRYGNFRPAYTIAMGDYNLNIFRPNVSTQAKNYLTEVFDYENGRQICHIITMQDQLTTLKDTSRSEAESEGGYANNYDHFTYSPELSHFAGVTCQAVDAVEKYCEGDFEYYRKNISDHVPIVMEIEL